MLGSESEPVGPEGIASINPSGPYMLGSKSESVGPEGVASINSICPCRLGTKREPVGPERNYFHQSFLALHVEDQKGSCTAWKELPPSILPSPECWGAKVNQ
jgi:hypothetical protein